MNPGGSADSGVRPGRSSFPGSAAIQDPGAQRQASLLKRLLMVLIALGIVTDVAQLVLVPGFLPTFAWLGGAIALFGVALLLARACRIKAAAYVTSLVIVGACTAIGLFNPADPVWYAFSLMGVLVATMFLPVPGALGVAAVAFAGVVAAVVVSPGLSAPDHWPQIVTLHLVLSPLLVVASWQGRRVERDRRLRERERQALLDEAQRIASVGHLVWYPETDVVAASPQLFRTLGVAPAREWTLTGLLEHVLPEDHARLRTALSSAVAHGPLYVDLRAVRPDGEERVLAANVERLDHGSEGTARVLATVQDLTDRVDAEEERERMASRLRDAERLEVLGKLAGGIAHDFNNLLSVVQVQAALLQNRTPSETIRREALRGIFEAAERAGTLTRQLLAYARRQELEPRLFDLRALLDDLTPLLRRLLGHGRELSVTHADGAMPIVADPVQIEQVVLNLASNAKQAMGERGVLSLETRKEDVDGQPWVVLSVRDTGCGMDEETLSRVFEPFFTTREGSGGTGLGLATVHGVVTQTGGRVDVSSTPGEGTTFEVRLPRAESVQPEVAEERAPRPAGRPLVVLLVEDDALLRDAAARGLRSHGHEVLEASGGEEAIDLAGSHTGVVDALVVDVSMPGLRGPEVARRVSALRPGIAVLLISGDPDAGWDLPDDMKERGWSFLPKPFTPRALVIRLDELADTDREEPPSPVFRERTPPPT